LVHEEDGCWDHPNYINWVPYDDGWWLIQVGDNLESTTWSYGVVWSFGGILETFWSLITGLELFPVINWIHSVVVT
jgi:hypothetical protein